MILVSLRLSLYFQFDLKILLADVCYKTLSCKVRWYCLHQLQDSVICNFKFERYIFDKTIHQYI